MISNERKYILKTKEDIINYINFDALNLNEENKKTLQKMADFLDRLDITVVYYPRFDNFILKSKHYAKILKKLLEQSKNPGFSTDAREGFFYNGKNYISIKTFNQICLCKDEKIQINDIKKLQNIIQEEHLMFKINFYKNCFRADEI